MAQRFRAILRGSEEVPPVRTNATGNFRLRLSEDRLRLHFRLTVNNLQNFTQAHIHIGARGVNGPVVAFLFGPVTRGISVNRGVVRGTLTRNDLVGPLQGRPMPMHTRPKTLTEKYAVRSGVFLIAEENKTKDDSPLVFKGVCLVQDISQYVFLLPRFFWYDYPYEYEPGGHLFCYHPLKNVD